MARCLIIACGCRGLELAGALIAQGHSVRASTRRADRLRELEDAGAEAVLGDPDRVATLVPALDHVTVAYILLGSARGDSDALAALHSTRLDMLLSKMLDSTVHGIIYEAAGSVPPPVLAGGAERVERFCADSRVPYSLLRADPAEYRSWHDAGVSALTQVLDPAAQAGS